MAKDTSEERKLPPSRKKLTDARKKGQVARSKDLVSGTALIGALGFLMLAGGGMLAGATAMFDRAGDVAAGDFATGLRAMGPVLRAAALHMVVPLYLIVPLLVVLSAMVMLRGIPFAVDPIAPRMENINPAEGFKRLFKLKSLIELLKSLIKMSLLGTAIVLVLMGGLQALMLVPACGLNCAGNLFHALLTRLVATACLLFLVAGLIDVGLQRWLFVRDQRMSVTEAKRERRDLDGDPLLRRERRRLLRDAARVAPLGLRRATLVLYDGQRSVVGVRFKVNETPVPLVVCRATGERAEPMLAEAARLELATLEDPELAARLIRIMPGQIIPQDCDRDVAVALTRAKLV